MQSVSAIEPTTSIPSPFSRVLCSHERTLEALTAVLEVLESAQLERDEDGGDRVLGDRVVLGLLVAARQLAAALHTFDRIDPSRKTTP